jgi:hypothetical protein
MERVNNVSPFSVANRLGGLNEVFYCTHKATSKDIVKRILNALANQNPVAVEEMQTTWKKVYPYTASPKVGLPINKIRKAQEESPSMRLEGNPKPFPRVHPGTNHKVELWFPDGKKVLSDITPIASEGVTFTKLPGGVFLLNVEPLTQKHPDGSVTKISADEYRHSTHFYPKNLIQVQIEGSSYVLSTRVQIPKRPGSQGGSGKYENSVTEADNSIDRDIYVKMDQSTPYGRYEHLKDKFYFNETNATVAAAFCFSPESDPKLARAAQRIMLTVLERARQAHIAINNLTPRPADFINPGDKRTYGDVLVMHTHFIVKDIFESAEMKSLIDDVAQLRQRTGVAKSQVVIVEMDEVEELV